jgi:hypothetical protein
MSTSLYDEIAGSCTSKGLALIDALNQMTRHDIPLLRLLHNRMIFRPDKRYSERRLRHCRKPSSVFCLAVRGRPMQSQPRLPWRESLQRSSVSFTIVSSD